MKQLYGAYGSNLLVEQMAWRCPTAKLYGSGVIEGYRLTFQGEPDMAYANIVPDEHSQVPMLVWELDRAAEKHLDRYEGYPRLYTKARVDARLDSGETVDVMVYVMTHLRPNLGVPSEPYYQCVEEGYREAGFALAPIETALAESQRSQRRRKSKAGGRNG